MDNIYYVPNEEEFRVEFEFEQINPVPVYDKEWRFKVRKRIFTKQDISSTMDLYRIILDLQNYDIRVKCLDKDDIEECGFRLLKDYTLTQEYQSTIITIRNTDYWYELDLDKDTKIIIITKWESYQMSGYSKILFQGLIKNKSELKVLLKQLNIINNGTTKKSL